MTVLSEFFELYSRIEHWITDKCDTVSHLLSLIEKTYNKLLIIEVDTHPLRHSFKMYDEDCNLVIDLVEYSLPVIFRAIKNSMLAYELKMIMDTLLKK